MRLRRVAVAEDLAHPCSLDGNIPARIPRIRFRNFRTFFFALDARFFGPRLRKFGKFALRYLTHGMRDLPFEHHR
jgi:hypothetical protein